MSEIEVSSAKKEKKRAKAREKAADVTEVDAVDTPADFSSENLLDMSSNFSSPPASIAISRLGDLQIELLNKLDQDSVSTIDLLNIVAMQQVFYKHGNKLQEEIDSTLRVLCGEFLDPSDPIFPSLSLSSSQNFPPHINVVTF